jgi:iron complex transport system ATP-binding protein
MSGRKGPLLETRDLRLGYRSGREGRLVASGINVGLERGEFVCLLGPNGSGKSTLLKTLAGMLPLMGGDCLLAGKPLGKLSLSERAELVSIVLTDQPNAGWFTAFQIVAFGRYPYTDARGRLSREDVDKVHAALDAVGLSSFADRRFAELSDGERRKVLVARALAQDSPLVLLDEPTIYLDAPSRIELFALARSLARDSGKALVLSTHDLDLALDSADRLWLMGPASAFPAARPSPTISGTPGRSADCAQSFFAEGLPEELALSGALGAAFSTASLAYDAASGGFHSGTARPPEPLAIAWAGDGASADEEETLLLWTRRLARRLGYKPVSGGAARRLQIAGKRQALRWRLETSGASGPEALEGQGLGALASTLLSGRLPEAGKGDHLPNTHRQ